MKAKDAFVPSVQADKREHKKNIKEIFCWKYLEISVFLAYLQRHNVYNCNIFKLIEVSK